MAIAWMALAGLSACGGGGSGNGTGGVGGAAAGSGGTAAPATGGVTATGGAAVTGTGGAPATGGAASSGGAPATGGGSVVGGATATGGGTATGGTSATGGGGPGGNAQADGGTSDGSADASTGGAGARGGVGGGTAGGAGGGTAGGAGGGAQPARKAAMVVRGAGTATAGDMVMLARLTARGIQTTLFSDAAVTAAAVASMDLIVISSSAESGPLGTKLRDVAIPMLCVENGQYRNQGMTGTSLDTNYGEVVNQTAISVLPGASALVGGATGTVTISRTAGPLGWGLPAATAVKGASVVGNANQGAIFGYAKGDQMVGMVAPARRAGFAIREVLAANLTADGIALFDAVLNWVLQ